VLSKPFKTFWASTLQKVGIQCHVWFFEAFTSPQHLLYRGHPPLHPSTHRDTYRYYVKSPEIGLIIFGKMTDGVAIQKTLRLISTPQWLIDFFSLTSTLFNCKPFDSLTGSSLHRKFSLLLVPPYYLACEMAGTCASIGDAR